MARKQLDDAARVGGTSELEIGTSVNDGTGNPLRTGGQRLKLWAADLNAMLTELYLRDNVIHLTDWNGFDTTGVNDNASILNAAHSQGLTAGAPIVVPSSRETGGILIGSTITGEVPMIGVASGYTNYGAGRVSARFLSGITNGSPVFSYQTGGNDETRDGFHLQNIAVEGAFTGSVAGGAQNCVAFRIGTIDGDIANGGIDTALSHGTLDNVTAYGCNVGFQVQGWMQTFRRVIAAYCNLGFRGQYLNASNIDLAFEGCGQGMVIDRTHGLMIPRYLDEGAAAYRSAASLIDNSQCIRIAVMYLECTLTGLTHPWLSVGETTQVNDFEIGSLQSPVTPAAGAMAPIKIHRVNGFRVPAFDASGVHSRSYIASERYSRNDRSPAPNFQYSAPTTPRKRGMQHAALDLLPNSFCEGIRFGCEDAFATGGGVVLSEETSIVRTGNTALRITSVVGGNNCGLMLRFYDDWAKRNPAADDDGNTAEPLTLGAWVWVPDLPGMQYPDDGAPMYLPSIGILRYDSGGTAGAGDIQYSPNLHVKKGAWNFMHTCLRGDTSTAIDSVCIGFWPHLSGAVNAPSAPNTPYIVVDSMHLAWGDCWEDMFEGRIQASPSAAGRVENGRLVMRKTQAQIATIIADTTQTHKVGDSLFYTNPGAGAAQGKVLTASGWKDMPSLAA